MIGRFYPLRPQCSIHIINRLIIGVTSKLALIGVPGWKFFQEVLNITLTELRKSRKINFGRIANRLIYFIRVSARRRHLKGLPMFNRQPIRTRWTRALEKLPSRDSSYDDVTDLLALAALCVNCSRQKANSCYLAKFHFVHLSLSKRLNSRWIMHDG